MMAKPAAKKGRLTKKRKGRPPRSNTPRHHRPPPPDARRNLRPRRRRLLHEDDDDDDEEEEERAHKKLKLVLKLPHVSTRGEQRCLDSVAGHVSADDSSSSSSYIDEELQEKESEEEEATKPLKKRRFDGCDGVSDGDARSDGSGDREEQRKSEGRTSKGIISGVRPDSRAATRLPDRRTLELVLDKLQKKDAYGVYAQPVDPEELPDYHEVIEHPMDFGTIRKKLGSNAYPTVEQLESDVFLLCTNAMRYNAPDTIYFKQARAIQELAKKKFQMLRSDGECIETGLESEEKIKSNSVAKMPLTKSICRTAQEPVGSDISSGATLASAADTCTVLNTAQASSVERPVNLNGFVDGSSSLSESKSDKADELSAKSSPSKLGQKPFVVDENRRATYNISNQQPVVQPDSLFAAFESEKKEIVAVGLDAEYSYPRSLARFAASLGPIAWRIASNNIERALPPGVKFGPGWVGEYEPLPTPVLSVEDHTLQQLGYSTNVHCSIASRKDKDAEKSKATHHGDSKEMQLGHNSGTSNRTSNPVEGSFCRVTMERKRGLFGSTAQTKPNITNAMFRQKDEPAVDLAKVHSNVSQRVQVSNSSFVSSTPVETTLRRPNYCSEVATSRLEEMVSKNRSHVQPDTLKQTESQASQTGHCDLGRDAGGFPSGRSTGNSDNSRLTSLDFVSNHRSGVARHFFSHSSCEQPIDDPVRLMNLSGKMFNQPNSSNLHRDAPKQVLPPIPSSRRETSSAATAAARAWMSLGASADHKSVTGLDLLNKQVGSASPFNNSTWENPTAASRIHGDHKIRPVPQVIPQHVQVVSKETGLQNKGSVIFPRLASTDMSRLHVWSPWQGLVPHTQHSQKKAMLPPDLNIGYQPPGSPVRPSSGIRIDSQQPDLALQL